MVIVIIFDQRRYLNFRKDFSPAAVLAGAVILLIAFAFWISNLGLQSIWFDEGWSAFAAAQPDVIAAANADATNPPLYYALLHVHARLFGESEFALRLFSVFLGMITCALSFRLASIWFGRRAAIFALAAVAFNPLIHWAAQEARMYTLLAALVMTCAIGFHGLLNRARWTAWLMLLAAELALLYAHNSGPVVVLWLNVVTVIAWISRRSLSAPDWRAWLAGQIGVGLLWLPYFVTRFLLLREANAALDSAPVLSAAFIADLWRALWETPWERVLLTPPGPLPLILFAFWLTACAVLVRRVGVRWALFHTFVLTGGLVAALVILGNELHGRYLVMIAPLALIPLGTALSRLRPAWLSWVGVSGLILLLAFTVRQNAASDFRHDDARAMVQYYADTLTSDDSVVAWSYADRYELAYYWDRLGVSADRITLPEGQDMDAVAPLLPTEGDVALNIWFTQRADFRGMLGCLFGHGTRRLPEEYTVHGMTSRLYRSPTLAFPTWVDADAAFGSPAAPAVRVIRRAEIPAAAAPDQALCLPIEIELLQPINADLKAALIVRSVLGWEIARADAVFATSNQRLTSQLAAGETATAFPLVRLPFGAPQGTYPVYLRIYDEQAFVSGLEPPRDQPAVGRDLLLGEWRVETAPAWLDTNREADLAAVAPVLAGDRTLIALGGIEQGQVLINGAEIRLSLLWTGRGDLPDLRLRDDSGAWEVVIPPTVTAADGILLDWRRLVIPAGAASGAVSLLLPDDTPIARMVVEAQPYIGEAPPFEHAAAGSWDGLAELVGYSLPEGALRTGMPADILLVWRAEAPSDTSLTVFVQLLDRGDQVVAQSDSVPARGERPTTGWRAGEFISDVHQLRWNEPLPSSAADLRLIVGLYDAQTGERIPTVNGDDHILLAADLSAQP
jgi:4-amino-4-deoxy-L-arabinose transferase-like glycosyltransferase